MEISFQSSGDLIADRRYHYGRLLAGAGDHAAAVDLFEQALERAPGWAAGWLALGRARRDTFDRAGAMEAFRTALRLAPEDPLGASLELARLDAAVTVDAAPTAYVEALFDAYAATFDRALVERLDYAAPQLIAAALDELPRDTDATPGRRYARVLDLGCGTGLMGEALVADAAYLEGVDLSANMIAEARGKGVYDNLEQADLLSALLADGPSFDLIVAADVLIYTGDLSPVLAAAANRLGPGGVLAFTVEATNREDGDSEWIIGPSLRFRHRAEYLRRLVGAAGLSMLRLETVTLRKDAGADVSGYLVVARNSVESRSASASCPPIDMPEVQSGDTPARLL